METQNNSILSRLDAIKAELDFIKENMVQKDEIMTSDEFESYQRSFDKENLVSLDDVKNQLGL